MILIKNPDFDECDKQRPPLEKSDVLHRNCDSLRQFWSQMMAFRAISASVTSIPATFRFRLTVITSHVMDVKPGMNTFKQDETAFTCEVTDATWRLTFITREVAYVKYQLNNNKLHKNILRKHVTDDKPYVTSVRSARANASP